MSTGTASTDRMGFTRGCSTVPYQPNKLQGAALHRGSPRSAVSPTAVTTRVLETLTMTHRLNGTGVWNSALRYGDASAAAEAAVEFEGLGYSALWVPDIGGDLFTSLENLLTATSSATIATGILNLWMHDATETAERFNALTGAHGRRLLFGIGVSHQILIEGTGVGTYEKPFTTMVEYLDRLDAEHPGVPHDDRVLAALGPRMLDLSRDRAGGAHTYLVTPEHTAVARDALGEDKLLAPEQAVVLETDGERARTIARAYLAGYAILPNYSNNWKRFGFTDDDVADGCSDRLVDALVAWGDEGAIRERVDAHRDAGADHVCIQVLGDDLNDFQMDQYRRLAPALV